MKILPYLYGGIIGAGLTIAVVLVMQQMKKAKDNKTAEDKKPIDPVSNDQPQQGTGIVEEGSMDSVETAAQRGY